jgi:hypothetical protein
MGRLDVLLARHRETLAGMAERIRRYDERRAADAETCPLCDPAARGAWPARPYEEITRGVAAGFRVV